MSAPAAAAATPATGTAGEVDLGSWDLVSATQAGDREAFGQLYDRYHPMVFRYLMFRVGDRDLVEDLTADTFVRALHSIAAVRYHGRDIGAWFITIARNLLHDHRKSSRYRLEYTVEEMTEVGPSVSGPEQEVLDRAAYEQLRRCVAQLPTDQRECVVLRFHAQLTRAETAQVMDRSEKSVRGLQHRAVRRLAQLLGEAER